MGAGESQSTSIDQDDSTECTQQSFNPDRSVVVMGGRGTANLLKQLSNNYKFTSDKQQQDESDGCAAYGEGKVYENEGVMWVLKQCLFDSEQAYKEYALECERRQRYKCDQIVKLLRLYKTHESELCSKYYKVYTAFEYLPCSLRQLIAQKKTEQNSYFSEIFLRKLLNDCLLALNFLQSKGSEHACVNPQTILYDTKSEEFKLTDACFMTGMSAYSTFLLRLPSSHRQCYLSVEQFRALRSKNIYSKKIIQDQFCNSDVFSLAMCTIEAATLTSISDIYEFDKYEVNFTTLAQKLQFVQQHYSYQLYSLLCKMSNECGDKRPSFSDCLKIIQQRYEQANDFKHVRCTPLTTIVDSAEYRASTSQSSDESALLANTQRLKKQSDQQQLDVNIPRPRPTSSDCVRTSPSSSSARSCSVQRERLQKQNEHYLSDLHGSSQIFNLESGKRGRLQQQPETLYSQNIQQQQNNNNNNSGTADKKDRLKEGERNNSIDALRQTISKLEQRVESIHQRYSSSEQKVFQKSSEQYLLEVKAAQQAKKRSARAPLTDTINLLHQNNAACLLSLGEQVAYGKGVSEGSDSLKSRRANRSRNIASRHTSHNIAFNLEAIMGCYKLSKPDIC